MPVFEDDWDDDICKWSVEKVIAFVDNATGCPDLYRPTLKFYNVDGETLAAVSTKNDLIELGIRSVHAAKVLSRLVLLG